MTHIPLVKKMEDTNDGSQQENAVLYFREKRIAIFLDCLLTGMYLKQPSDPIDWCMQFLIMHDSFDALVDIRMLSSHFLNYLHCNNEIIKIKYRTRTMFSSV